MPFDTCWAKIERAKEHSDALDAHLDEVFSIDANCPVLGTKGYRDGGGKGIHKNVVYVSYAPDLTEAMARAGVLLGDAIHNLRSALDHLAYQLALKNRGKLTETQERSVYFPICKEQKDWPKEWKRKLRYVGRLDREVIKRYQPFSPPHDNVTISNTPPDFHPLLALERLDIIDKHRLIPTVIMDAGGYSSNSINPGILMSFVTGTIERQDRVIRVEKGAEVYTFLTPKVLLKDVEMDAKITPNVSLEDGTPIQPMIKRMAAVIVKLLREFDPIP